MEHKVEYGRLPADYKDPELGEDTTDEEDNKTAEVDKTSVSTEMPETVTMEMPDGVVMESQEKVVNAAMESPIKEDTGCNPVSKEPQGKPMYGDDRDSGREESKYAKYMHREPHTPLYYRNRMFFGSEIKEIMVKMKRFNKIKYRHQIMKLKAKGGKKMKAEQRRLRSLFSHRDFGKENYFREMCKVMPGIISTNFNCTEWCDVMNEYEPLLMDMPILAIIDYEKLVRFFKENFLIKHLEALESEISRDSSIKHQVRYYQRTCLKVN